MKKVEFWDWVNMIRRKELYARIDDLDFSNFSPYITLRALAMDSEVVQVVNKLNKYTYSLPKDLLFRLYYFTIPKRTKFVKFAKRKKRR